MKLNITFITALTITAMLSAFASPVYGAQSESGKAQGPPNKLQCFSGTDGSSFGGSCFLTNRGAMVDTIEADDPYAGVYVMNAFIAGKRVEDITKFTFDYKAQHNPSIFTGSPMVSIAVREPAAVARFALINIASCNGGSATAGTFNLVGTADCTVTYENVNYSNWKAFTRAHAGAVVEDELPVFIIVDSYGMWDIGRVELSVR